MTQLQSAAIRQREVECWWWSLEDEFGLGNKRYKLKPYLKHARKTACTSLLSFGGAYSNHLHALAAVAKSADLGSIGVVRGQSCYSKNPTLSGAIHNGMRLEFVSRSEYRHRYQLAWLNQWKNRYPDSLIIPEGGSGATSASACQRMLDGIDPSFMERIDTLCCALGTGTTVLGLHAEYGLRCAVKGYDVVNDPTVVDRLALLRREMGSREMGRVEMGPREIGLRAMKVAEVGANQVTLLEASLPTIVNASGAGFGRCSSAIYSCIETVFNSTGLLLDPIYTGKMASYLLDEIRYGMYKPGTVLLAVHTGGLQGWRGKWTEAKRYLSPGTMNRISHALAKYQLAPNSIGE